MFDRGICLLCVFVLNFCFSNSNILLFLTFFCLLFLNFKKMFLKSDSKNAITNNILHFDSQDKKPININVFPFILSSVLVLTSLMVLRIRRGKKNPVDSFQANSV